MTRLADLSTLAEVNAVRRAMPKSDLPTKLDRKVAKDRTADTAWRACCKAVDARDGILCRHCGCKTVRSLELLPNRAEHAHIVRRRKASALSTDSRNVLLLCYSCHSKFDTHQLRIEQPLRDQFEFAGTAHVNANKRTLRFVKVK